jgi:molybdate transport system substrate-binding protein
MTSTRFMCALVIVDAVRQDLLSPLGTRAPEILWEPTAALMKRIEGGERADGIFAIDGALDELEKQGVIDGATRRPLVQAEFGIAVQRGMNLSVPANGDALKGLLIAAPSIVYSRAGASGIYFEKLIDRLGIGPEVRAKSLVIPAGLTGEKVRDGEAALAVQQMSELRAVEGIDIVGPFPADVQQTTDFSAAVFADAADRAGAEAFIAALTTPAARAAYLACGLKVKF